MELQYTTKHLDGMAFEMTLDGHHTLIMDAENDFGGKDRGPRPKQLLISALTGCAGIEIVSILEKMRIDFSGFEIQAEAQMTETHPKVYTHIHLTYQLTGRELEKARGRIERAIELTHRQYCGVAAMLSQAATLTYALRLLPE